MSSERRQFLAGLRVTTFWTMTSRVLGMGRDIATAALLGMSSDGVMDAFVIAFRIPNLFRRLFGEGALAASYLPVLTERLEKDRTSAWQLASVTLTWLAVALSALVVVSELAFWGLGTFAFSGDARMELLLGLSAVMLPYLLFICLAAQVSATLHALGHFSLPAFVPVLLNVVWIVGAVVIAPYVTDQKATQAYVLAICILVGGVLQLVVQLPVLRGLGFRFDYNWPRARRHVLRVVTTLLPMLLGLAVTQINTLLDSVIAWCLSASDTMQSIAWLGDRWDYPMQQGAASAIYFGERMYQLPLGVLGVAVATVIFPLLSRHSARGDHERLGADLTLGLRLVLFLAVPAGVGLILLGQPLARLLFEHGEFTALDAQRTGRMIAFYGSGVWAYCALPVLVRGFYATGNPTTPVKVGAAMVAANLTMNLILVWPLAEAGLALATAVSASAQVVILAVIFARTTSPLDWRTLGITLARSIVATIAMGLAGALVLRFLPTARGLQTDFFAVAIPLITCVVVYLSVYSLLGGPEWRWLTGRRALEDGTQND